MILISIALLKCNFLCRPLDATVDNFIGCVCQYDGGYVIPERKNEIEKIKKVKIQWQERRKTKE
jgi:hypothetical protein